jgi:cobyrinic acid a,c-diamide synthase
MIVDRPRLVIAGTGSGVGKTSVTLGLARLLARRGLRVQTFKVGPDFLDPTYLAMASGRTCYNLDGWMTSREYVRKLFARATGDADMALIEGVMGMFDGASPRTLEGSTAEIAGWLDAPVLLVENVHGRVRSLAATVKGFAEFEPGARVAGVIANQGGSQRHRELLAESLAAAGTAPLVGMLPHGSLPALPSRHLGLVTADHAGLTAAVFEQLADVCDQHLEIARLVELARSAKPLQVESPGGDCPNFRGLGRENGTVPLTQRRENGTVPLQPTMSQSPRRVRLGIARDAAFHFYYPDNLEMLARCGAELAFFSPLGDRRLPDGLDGLYFGGGYPEAHAESLAANAGMCAEVRRFASAGGWVYAECGGLMYLGRSLTTLDRRHHAMAGVLPVDTAMLDRLKMLGYAEVALAADSLWGPAGRVCRGHDFHYSEIVGPPPADLGWTQVYRVRRADGAPAESEGFQNGRVLASYVHLHFASRPELAAHFVTTCGNRR